MGVKSVMDDTIREFGVGATSGPGSVVRSVNASPAGLHRRRRRRPPLRLPLQVSGPDNRRRYSTYIPRRRPASALAVPAKAPVAVPIAPPTIAPTGPASAAPFISPTAAPDTGFDGYPGAGAAYCAIAALDVPTARAATTAKTLNLVAIITSFITSS